MSKTVRIRNIDDEVYAGLLRRAGEEGITVPELLRRAAVRLATDRRWRSGCNAPKSDGRSSPQSMWSQSWTSGAASGPILLVDRLVHRRTRCKMARCPPTP